MAARNSKALLMERLQDADGFAAWLWKRRGDHVTEACCVISEPDENNEEMMAEDFRLELVTALANQWIAAPIVVSAIICPALSLFAQHFAEEGNDGHQN
jgi:hypothetical protein